MTEHPVIVSLLVGLAAAITVLSAFAMAVMGSVYQRLHFLSPVTSLAAFLVVAAIWISGCTFQAGIKATLTAVILLVVNGVLSHATARASRIRQTGHWTPEARDVIRPEAQASTKRGEGS